MADLNDVMHALGRVQATVDMVAADVADEKVGARESRAVVHRRLDEQAHAVAKLETAMAQRDGFDAALRKELAELSKNVRENITPAVGDWQRAKQILLGLLGLLTLGGISLVSLLWMAGEAAVNLVRAWLRIP